MFKSANVGTVDRILRGVIGIGLGVFAYTSLLSPWSSVAYAVAAVLILTAFVRFCPAYHLLGINSCKISGK